MIVKVRRRRRGIMIVKVRRRRGSEKGRAFIIQESHLRELREGVEWRVSRVKESEFV
jgi:hypothetical protein